MVETVLNWLVLLFSAFVLVAIAWVSFRDLRAAGEVRAPQSGFRSMSPTVFDRDLDAPETESTARHRLRVEYYHDGALVRTQSITEEKPGFIGTEQMRGMGPGVLVRHARVAYTGGGFAVENRHGSQPLLWRADNGRSGELNPGEALPVDGEVDLLLGGWQVTCREES